jgi:hypothetical protein
MERNTKYDNFKMDASKVGGYIVKKSRLVERSIILGVVICDLTDECVWGIFKVDFYNKDVHPNNSYKAKLIPVGPFSINLQTENMYCSDIESSLTWNKAEYFDDPFNALDFANKKNAELYPEYSEYFGIPKKLSKFQQFIKKLFKL